MGSYRTARPALTRRDNEFLGDMAAWEQSHSGDNSEQLARLRRNLRRVWEAELTARQSQMLHMYYEQGLSMPQIAGELGITKSAVSRTLSRGRSRLKSYLQYSL